MTDQTNPSNSGEPAADDVSKARPAPEYGWYAPGFDPNAPKESAQAAQPTQLPQYPQNSQYGQSQSQSSPYGPPMPAQQFGAQGGSVLPQTPVTTDTLAVVSLVSSLVGLAGMFTFGGLFAVALVVAVITGHLALYRIKRSRENGRGMAIAGLVIGYVGLALILLAVAAFIYLLANPDMLREILNDPTITSQFTPEQLDQLRDFLGESGSATGTSFGTNGGQNV